VTPWFNPRKAAQVAAYFAMREGGSINVLKLAKLIYLADRKNMETFDFPITGDNLVSMDHGPVNSITLNCINGLETERGEWAQFVTDRDNYYVGVAVADLTVDDLDELSAAELSTLDAVWAQFGGYTKYDLRDWVHQNCPEWEDPGGSSNPIPFSRVFGFLGKTDARELEQQIMVGRAITQAFAEA
jgi:uncharacterized phage-associated protein